MEVLVPATPSTLPLTLSTLPAELLLLISAHLDTSSYITLSQSSTKFRFLLCASAIPWSLHTTDPKEVTINRTAFDVEFKQSDTDLHETIHDSIVHISEQRDGQVHLSMVYRGMRYKGDRSVVGGMPLGLLPQSWTTDEKGMNQRMAYFEMTILEVPEGDEWSESCKLRIGVARDEMYSAHHPVGCLPHSVGYCGEDGTIALGHRDGERFLFAPGWGKVGDVVGCGYIIVGESRWTDPKELNLETSQWTLRCTIFFTLNGQWVGDAPHLITTTPYDYRSVWYPVITASSPCKVHVNLGKHQFLFRPANDSTNETHLDHKLISPLLAYSTSAYPTLYPNNLSPSSDPYPSPKLTLHTPTTYTIEFPPPFTTHEVPRSILSTPITRTFYYEITIRVLPANPFSFLSFGLAAAPYSPFHHIGWDAHSIGYHTDDGRVYNGTFCRGVVYDSDPMRNVRVGTVLGCGYDARDGIVFFTRDGGFLGVAAKAIWGALCLGVAAGGDWVVEMNFSGRSSLYFGWTDGAHMPLGFPI